MQSIERTVQSRIQGRLKPGKAVIIYGARRVGKSILMQQVTQTFKGKVLTLNGEDMEIQALLEPRSVTNYRRLLEGVDLLAIDEAQYVPDIGMKIKLMVDEIPQLRILATGSSSFDLYNQVGEPLVGRAAQFLLTPFSQQELAGRESGLETAQNLETRLIFGSYPETLFIKSFREKTEYLREVVNSYLLRDILAIDGIKNSSKMANLLRLVAYQTGNEVSFEELGRQLGLSKNTVEKYMDLLSKVFIVYRLPSFSRNLRKEVVKNSKWYFYDNGIRNGVINDFAPLNMRQDVGALWESYCLSERRKQANNSGAVKDFYFWRTYDRQEIDLVEEDSTGLHAFEFKWGDKKKKMPIAFEKAYAGATWGVIRRDNYMDFILG